MGGPTPPRRCSRNRPGRADLPPERPQTSADPPRPRRTSPGRVSPAALDRHRRHLRHHTGRRRRGPRPDRRLRHPDPAATPRGTGPRRGSPHPHGPVCSGSPPPGDQGIARLPPRTTCPSRGRGPVQPERSRQDARHGGSRPPSTRPPRGFGPLPRHRQRTLRPTFPAPASRALPCRKPPSPVRTRRGDGMSFDPQAALREILPKVTQSLDDAGITSDDTIRAFAKAAITDLVREYVDSHALAGRNVPNLDEEHLLAEAVYNEIFELGRLQPFVDDPEVENIDVNGCDQVWITYSDGRKALGPPVADSDEQLVENVRRWAAYQGQTSRDFSIARPRLHLSVGNRTRMAALM